MRPIESRYGRPVFDSEDQDKIPSPQGIKYELLSSQANGRVGLRFRAFGTDGKQTVSLRDRWPGTGWRTQVEQKQEGRRKETVACFPLWFETGNAPD